MLEFQMSLDFLNSSAKVNPVTTVDGVKKKAPRSAVAGGKAPSLGRHTHQANCGSTAPAEHGAFSSRFDNASTTGRSLSDLISCPPAESNSNRHATPTARTYRRRSRVNIHKSQNPVGFRCYLDSYNGRWLVRFSDAGIDRLMLRSRFLMECKLGRPLLRREQVRHVDFNSTNDALSNLYIFEQSDLEAPEFERKRRAAWLGGVT